MPKNTVLILHGWSDTYESFQTIRQFLCDNGYTTQSVYLGAYRSMEDHTTFDNIADGLQARLDKLCEEAQLPVMAKEQDDDRLRLAPFSIDVIAHSTGGPVIRHWLTRYLKNVCEGDLMRCPVRRMLLLAPANFGSRLAAQGQSALAMIFKGGIKHGFQTGRAILQGLELGSPFLCDLAERDLFSGASIYPVDGQKGPYVFIFSGTATYERLKGLVAPGANENGSDGTVRASSASLSSVKLIADFRQPTPRPAVTLQANKPIAFKLVEGKNHTEIVPKDGDTKHPMLPLLLECLAVERWDQYEAILKRFRNENDAFYGARAKHGVRRYQQFVIRVRDDMDVDVDDYQLSFHVIDDEATTSTWSDQRPGQALTRYQEYTTRLQEKVIVHAQTHTAQPSYRTFFIDLDELDALERDLAGIAAGPFVAMNIEAFSPTPDVVFNTDNLHYIRLDKFLADAKAPQFFFPNTTTLIEIKLKPTIGPEIFDLRATSAAQQNG